MIVALIALFVSLGGVSYGVATGYIDGREIKNNAVGTKDLKNNDVRSGDVRNNSLTGADVNEASLGPVPRAASADSAANATQLGGTAAVGYAKSTYESLHAVGAPGQPAFGTGWSNFGGSFAVAGFYKDSLGIVHLQGSLTSGPGQIAFTLPQGYRPTGFHYQVVAEGGDQFAHVTISTNGTVNVFDYVPGQLISLEFIAFEAGQ
jgi:hypothetical protein